MLVARGTVGALPQTPAGTLSLHPARGNCPLTPFLSPGLVAFPYPLGEAAFLFALPMLRDDGVNHQILIPLTVGRMPMSLRAIVRLSGMDNLFPIIHHNP